MVGVRPIRCLQQIGMIRYAGATMLLVTRTGPEIIRLKLLMRRLKVPWLKSLASIMNRVSCEWNIWSSLWTSESTWLVHLESTVLMVLVLQCLPSRAAL